MSQFDKNKSRIIQNINNGYRVVVLMRGLPGSGKSTLARHFISKTVNENPSQFVLSADDFFMKGAEYRYDSSLVGQAHTWNQNRAAQLMQDGVSPIIIDNTNLKLLDMTAYCAAAVRNGYILETIEVETPWAHIPRELGRRNVHGVPKQKIEMMSSRYERNLSGDDILKALNLNYKPEFAPPRPRNYPPFNSPKGHINFNNNVKNKPDNNRSTQNNASTPSVDLQKDMIDLTSNYAPKYSIAADLPGNNDCISLIDDSNELWTGAWEVQSSKANKDVAPKPPRSASIKMRTAASHSDDLINWEPIDVSMSNWNKQIPLPPVCADKPQVLKCDASIMTERNNESKCENSLKILNARNRDINESYDHCMRQNVLPLKPMFHKGVMTTDDLFINEQINPNNKEELLGSMFKDIPKKHIKEMLERCGGDMNWIAECILDGHNEVLDLNEGKEEDGSAIDNDQDKNDDIICVEHVDDNNSGNITVKEVSDKNSTSGRNTELKLDLKKQLEQSFEFSPDNYSEHHLKIKNHLRKKYVTDWQSSKENDQCMSIDNNCIEINDEVYDEQASGSPNGANENCIQFRIGQEFVEQLNSLYDTSYLSTENIEPVINMPQSLVDQIYALWVQSICTQVEQSNTLRKEDEEFARKLQEEEEKNDIENAKLSSFREIMDMELAYRLAYQPEKEQESPEDMATKLTQLKLVEMFPEIEKNVLLEIYKAHDNNFEQTFEVLLLSTGKITEQSANIDRETLLKFYADQERQLMEKANRQKEKICESKEIEVVDLTTNVEELQESVKEFRQEAQRHLQMRNENLAKAREYCAKGMTQVAWYFSQLAATHTNHIERANSLAASRIMQLNISGENNTTLDLHTLFVAEAIQILDLFIDNHISKARERTNCIVTTFIITGRGKHSPGNRPRIKPAVINRLKQRRLKSVEVNPGLLKAWVTPGDILTSETQPSCSRI